MENKKEVQSTFSRVMIKGIPYYRTRIKDADGKRVSLYARTERAGCKACYGQGRD